MRVLLAIVLAACGSGGGEEPAAADPVGGAELTMKLAPGPPGSMIIDVETEPGAEVYCIYPPGPNGTTVCPDQTADAAGKAQLSVSTAAPVGHRFEVQVIGSVFRDGRRVRAEQLVKMVLSATPVALDITGRSGRCHDHACTFEGIPGGVRFTELEAGAVIEHGGAPVAPEADGKVTVRLTDDALIGTVSLQTLAHETGGHMPARITVAWKDGTRQELPIYVEGGLAAFNRRMLEVRRGPVALPGDSGPLGNSLFLATVDEHASPFHRIFGPGRKLQDLGLVAVVTAKSPVKRTCGPYSAGQGPTSRLEMTFADADVKVFTRSTGKAVASKRFASVKTCPKSFKVTSLQDTYRSSVQFDDDEIAAWLRTVIAR